MADWNKPITGDLYTDVINLFKSRDLSAALMFDSELVNDTNLSTGVKRWNATNKNWQRWSGSGWTAMADVYNISISGSAATAGNVTGIVAIANGGTGATTAEDARVALGVEAAGSSVALAIALG